MISELKKTNLKFKIEHQKAYWSWMPHTFGPISFFKWIIPVYHHQLFMVYFPKELWIKEKDGSYTCGISFFSEKEVKKFIKDSPLNDALSKLDEVKE